MDSVFWKIWQYLPHSFNCWKVGRVQLSSNFFLLLSLILHSRVGFEHAFLKTYIKSGNITEKKNKTLKDFKYFLILKWRQNWIKLNSVRSLWLCGETNRHSSMLCPLCVETKMKKTKVVEVSKVCQISFRFFQTNIFELNFV